jgi:hypothetical protein
MNCSHIKIQVRMLLCKFKLLCEIIFLLNLVYIFVELSGFRKQKAYDGKNGRQHLIREHSN